MLLVSLITLYHPFSYPHTPFFLSEGGRQTCCDPPEPAATDPPGTSRAVVCGPPAPRDRTANPARQYEQPGPLSGLAFGKPSRRSSFFFPLFNDVSVLLDVLHLQSSFCFGGSTFRSSLFSFAKRKAI